MPTRRPVGAVAVSCFDMRDHDVSASIVRKMTHMVGGIISDRITCDSAEEIKRRVQNGDINDVLKDLTLNRAATSGGGWTSEGGRNLRTMTQNGFEVVALYTGRHKDCKSIKKGLHYSDPDVAVMIAHDLQVAELSPNIPVFRTHLEIKTNDLEIDRQPMNLQALAAHAHLYGTSKELSAHPVYVPSRSLAFLGVDYRDRGYLQELADSLEFDEDKGLLKYNFD